MDGFKTRGVWGGAAPPFAHKMIRIALSHCKHGDCMMRLFFRSMDGPRGSKGNNDDNYEDRDPDPTILATVDMFQTPGSEGLKDDPQNAARTRGDGGNLAPSCIPKKLGITTF